MKKEYKPKNGEEVWGYNDDRVKVKGTYLDGYLVKRVGANGMEGYISGKFKHYEPIKK